MNNFEKNLKVKSRMISLIFKHKEYFFFSNICCLSSITAALDFVQIKVLTCFISGDGELIAGITLANQVFGKHTNVVGGGGMKVDDGGLV